MTEIATVSLADLASFEGRAGQAILGHLSGKAPAALAGVATQSLIPAVEAGLSSALDTGLPGLLASAWSRAAELAALAHPADPQETRIVNLASHSIDIEVDPELSIEVEGIPAWKIPLTVQLQAHLDAAALHAKAGHIHAVSPGSIRLTGEILLQGEELPIPIPESRHNLPGPYRLDPPVAISRFVP